MTPSATTLMRCRPPPENMLKKSSTPPLVPWNRAASARGSMPGSGTKLRKRKMISAPSVNQRRFLRSVAFEKFERLKLAAICSAADAIVHRDPGKGTGGGTAVRPPAISYNVRFRLVSLQPSAGCSGRRFGAALGGALLRRSLFGSGHDLDHLDRSAGGLDRPARSGRDTGDAEGKLRRDRALAEQANAILAA